MNDSIKSVIVLTAICLIVTLLLSVVNFYTKDVIAANADKAVQESLKAVLPEAASFEEVAVKEGSPETVKTIFKDTAGTGYALALETTSQYSEAPMAITVGIGTDGIIKNIVVTNYAETKDFGADYPSTYIGQDSALSGVDTVAGVTYSSAAFRNAISDAYTALFAVADVAEGEKSDSQMAAEAIAEFVPASLNNAGACDITEEDGLFKASNKTAYAMVADKVVYVADAFGNYLGAKSFDETASENADVADSLKASASAAYASSGEKTKDRIMKIFNDAEISVMTLNGVVSTVNGAFSFTSGGSNYFAFTASPYGYGGVMNLLYVVDENGTIVKFKVTSHNETEYYGEVVAESGYTGKYEGAALNAVGDEITVIAGCTYTTEAVKTALVDVTAAFNTAKEVR